MIKKRFLVVSWRYISLSLCIICLLSCATSGSQIPDPPEYVSWAYLTSLNRETPGYAMYTYVLFNRRTILLEESNPDIAETYLSLLKAIEIASSSEKSDHRRADERNIFYIPSIDFKKERLLSLDNYNINLSLSYISRFITVMKTDYEIVEQFATGPGPFLVSLFSPLQHAVNTSMIYKNNFPIFFVDLSHLPLSSFEEVVTVYDELFIRKEDTGIRTLESLKSNLGELLPSHLSEFKVLKASAQ